MGRPGTRIYILLLSAGDLLVAESVLAGLFV
jgi:hypothetical protein